MKQLTEESAFLVTMNGIHTSQHVERPKVIKLKIIRDHESNTKKT